MDKSKSIKKLLADVEVPSADLRDFNVAAQFYCGRVMCCRNGDSDYLPKYCCDKVLCNKRIKRKKENNMKPEDKALLLRDLCVRLPYGVCVNKYNDIVELCKISANGYCQTLLSDEWNEIEELKPYLLPLSSMTAKHFNEYRRITDNEFNDCLSKVSNSSRLILHRYIDYLNKHHFDYRGLIDKGLAIDATNLNIY